MPDEPSALAELVRLMSVRRDVRHFKESPVDPASIEQAVRVASLAPSVGYSQPWRWVRVDDARRRQAVIASHDIANEHAREAVAPERRDEYARLKLSGLREAPVHLAVFCDTTASTGGGLGRQTMPESLHYSVAMAIYGFWLAARALGLGVGWVSILETATVARTLDVPAGWDFIAYLAVGYPAFESGTPELVERGWEHEDTHAARILIR